MNKEIKKRWLKALRDGNYDQGTEALHPGDEFCCLGVLCDLHKIKEDGDWDEGEYEGENGSLPDIVMEWANLPDSNPDVVPIDDDKDKVSSWTLAGLNDAGYTFNEIADIIEKEF